MSPEAYLRLSIKHKAHLRKDWLLGIFAVTRLSDKDKANPYIGMLIREPFGIFIYNDQLEQVKLDTPKKATEALFHPSDRLMITSEDIASLQQEKLETSVGTYLYNLITLYEAFGEKIPYQAGKLSIRKLEALIAPRLKDEPEEGQAKDPNALYPSELNIFRNGITHLKFLSGVIANSITKVGLLPAPGRKEFKATLLKKYEGKLDDPVQLAQFEKELTDFDNEYLKQDPAYGKFMKGKVLGARKDLFLTLGAEEDGFSNTGKITPVVNSLEDGVPLTPKEFSAQVNQSRYSSFSRGAETVNGGVVAKDLGRAGDSWTIQTDPGDCGATLGLARIYQKEDIHFLIGRHRILNGKSILIKDQSEAEQFINQKVVLRSPQYCRLLNDNTCAICATGALSKYPNGLPIPMGDVSGGILNDSLKKMHNNKIVTVPMDLNLTLT